MKTAAWCAAMTFALWIIREVLGDGIALTVATAGFSFAIGALWGAGKTIHEATETKR